LSPIVKPSVHISESVSMIPPYGGTLVDLLVTDPAERTELRRRAVAATAIELSQRSLCDLELLATGAFSPLNTFMGESDYRGVVRGMRLACGMLYPIPVTLPLSETVRCRPGDVLALQDHRRELLAVLTVDEIFGWDRSTEAMHVYGTADERHPLVAEMSSWAARYVTGTLRVLKLPHHASFRELRLTPSQVRVALAALGRDRIVAFQTRNPMHRVHEELTKRAVQETDGSLLIHPVVGQTKPGDVSPYTRVLCYTELVKRYYDPTRTFLSLLPLAMRMAGPREALWHAIIRRNYGANHMIVGRDHAGPGLSSNGHPFYGPRDAQDLVKRYEAETQVRALGFEELAYVPEEDRYIERSCLKNRTCIAISGTEVREGYLAAGRALPAWFTRREVAAILSEAVVSKKRQGFCVWLMGLSGAGKSTLAATLGASLRERGREVTILDGDVVRAEMSSDLGFSREDRDTNVLRIGSMAAEIVRSGGAVICAVITPFAAARALVRNLIGGEQFVLVYVDTPLSVCEQRDAKGLYARARRGEISSFTGIDDPFEIPTDASLHLDTSTSSRAAAVSAIVSHLLEKGLVSGTLSSVNEDQPSDVHGDRFDYGGSARSSPAVG
jgi:sulfate adenylyltransferase